MRYPFKTSSLFNKDNQIGKDGAEALVDGLKVNTTLQELSLWSIFFFFFFFPDQRPF